MPYRHTIQIPYRSTTHHCFITKNKKTMKSNTLLSLLLTLGLSLTLLTSCRNNEIQIILFEASLEIQTPDVHDGEDFIFDIHSTKFPFTVTKLECDFMDSDVIAQNMSYDRTKSDYHRFTFSQVEVNKASRKTIKVTIRDDSTGKTIDLKGSFQAYPDMAVSILIDLPLAEGDNLKKLNVPVVYKGEEVPVVVKSKFKELYLEDFNCEFDTEGVLQKGMKMEFDKNGEWRYTFPAASFEEEVYNIQPSIRMSFRSNSAAIQDVLEASPASYVLLKKPVVNIQVLTPTLYLGQYFKCKITANKSRLKVKGIESVLEALSLQPAGTEEFVSLGDKYSFIGDDSYTQEVFIPQEGLEITSKSSPEFTTNGTQRVKFVFKEHLYSGMEIEKTISFSAQKQISDNFFEFREYDTFVSNGKNTFKKENGSCIYDTYSLKVGVPKGVDTSNIPETEFVLEWENTGGGNLIGFNKSVQTQSAAEKLSEDEFKIEKQQFKFTLSKEKQEQLIFFRADKTPGKVKIYVYPKDNRNAAKSIEITVQQDVAVMIDGDITSAVTYIGNTNKTMKVYDYIYGKPDVYIFTNKPCDHFDLWKEFGWRGFVNDMTAEVKSLTMVRDWSQKEYDKEIELGDINLGNMNPPITSNFLLTSGVRLSTLHQTSYYRFWVHATTVTNILQRAAMAYDNDFYLNKTPSEWGDYFYGVYYGLLTDWTINDNGCSYGLAKYHKDWANFPAGQFYTGRSPFENDNNTTIGAKQTIGISAKSNLPLLTKALRNANDNAMVYDRKNGNSYQRYPVDNSVEVVVTDISCDQKYKVRYIIHKYRDPSKWNHDQSNFYRYWWWEKDPNRDKIVEPWTATE